MLDEATLREFSKYFELEIKLIIDGLYFKILLLQSTLQLILSKCYWTIFLEIQIKIYQFYVSI